MKCLFCRLRGIFWCTDDEPPYIHALHAAVMTTAASYVGTMSMMRLICRDYAGAAAPGLVWLLSIGVNSWRAAHDAQRAAK